MFKAFTFKSLALLGLAAAVTAVGVADPALAKRKKLDVPGHWERSEDGGFEWVGKKPKQSMGGDPVVRDHRTTGGGGGVTVSDTPVVRDHRTTGGGGGVTVSNTPVVRDHRAEPIIRDHRAVTVRDNRKKKKIFGMPVWN